MLVNLDVFQRVLLKVFGGGVRSEGFHNISVYQRAVAVSVAAAGGLMNIKVTKSSFCPFRSGQPGAPRTEGAGWCPFRFRQTTATRKCAVSKYFLNAPLPSLHDIPMATHVFLSSPNTLHVCVYASDGDRIQATIAYASGNTSPNRHTHTHTHKCKHIHAHESLSAHLCTAC